MKSLSALLLFLAALLMGVSAFATALSPFEPNRGASDVAQHWALNLRTIILGPVLYAGFAFILEAIHRISLRVGGWRAENLSFGRLLWRHGVSRVLLAGALFSLLLSLPGGVRVWL